MSPWIAQRTCLEEGCGRPEPHRQRPWEPGRQGRGRALVLQPHPPAILPFFLTEREEGKRGLKPQHSPSSSVPSANPKHPLLRGLFPGRRCQCDSRAAAPGAPSPALFTIPGSLPLSRSKHGKSGTTQPSESPRLPEGPSLGTEAAGPPVSVRPAPRLAQHRGELK